jgi:hypothetical protein
MLIYFTIVNKKNDLTLINFIIVNKIVTNGIMRTIPAFLCCLMQRLAGSFSTFCIWYAVNSFPVAGNQKKRCHPIVPKQETDRKPALRSAMSKKIHRDYIPPKAMQCI